MKNQLEELRRQHAIRQEDLAQALGVSRQTVISLEKGKYNPSLGAGLQASRGISTCPSRIFSTTATTAPTRHRRDEQPPRIGRQAWVPRRILL